MHGETTLDAEPPVVRRMRSRIVRTLLVAVAPMGIVAAACGEPESAPSASGEPDGAALYRANCASCHGVDLGGTTRGPSHLSIVYEPGHHPDDAFRAAIRNGAPQHHWDFGPMPPVEGLSGDEVEAIIAFVRAEQERRGFEP